jgi:hypothetical protein
MTDIGYISDTEEVINTSWSNIQDDGVIAFKLLEQSAVPQAFSAKDLPRGRTQLSNVR